MPAVARPDLSAIKDAYKVLGLDYSADSDTIRHAHKRLAKKHHPDRFPVGSAEQQRATDRMATINDAYGLIRDAPLRNHHPVSDPQYPPPPSINTELEDALRDMNQKGGGWITTVEGVDRWMTVGLVGMAIAVLVLMAGVNVFKTRRALQISEATLRQSTALIGSSREASGKKMSAQELESQLIEASSNFADFKLRCERETTAWDYICSYTPTDSTVFVRMHFGANVDSNRVLQISPTVPVGVPVPPSGL